LIHPLPIDEAVQRPSIPRRILFFTEFHLLRRFFRVRKKATIDPFPLFRSTLISKSPMCLLPSYSTIVGATLTLCYVRRRFRSRPFLRVRPFHGHVPSYSASYRSSRHFLGCPLFTIGNAFQIPIFRSLRSSSSPPAPPFIALILFLNERSYDRLFFPFCPAPFNTNPHLLVSSSSLLRVSRALHFAHM